MHPVSELSVSYDGLNLPSDWQAIGVPDCLIGERIRVGKVKRSDYLDKGEYPIVDQGQKLIAGYWNKKPDVYDGDLPVIVFGDHTRCFKFVDFPFVCGADGTKVLLPNSALLDPVFLYFALLTVELPSRGYNRHYRLLKEKFVPLPPLPEQRVIAQVLRTVQRAREQTERVIAAARELKRSLMRHLFTYGPIAASEVSDVALTKWGGGEMPTSWRAVPIGEIANTRTGGTPDRGGAGNFGSGVPWLKSGELDDAHISSATESITENALARSNAVLLPKGTLLIALYGATAGRVGILDLEAATNQAVCAITPEPGVATSSYLFHVLVYRRAELLAQRHGGAQPNLSQRLLKLFELPIPPLQEQSEIARELDIVDDKIEAEEARLNALGVLFASLLHGLMTARLRVDHLAGELA